MTLKKNLDCCQEKRSFVDKRVQVNNFVANKVSIPQVKISSCSMKLTYVVAIIFIFITTVASLTEYSCSTPFTGDDGETKECEEGGLRNFKNTLNFIELINCPKGVESDNQNCKGMANPDKPGKFWSYSRLVSLALEDYGCNCFLNSFKIPNVRGYGSISQGF